MLRNIRKAVKRAYYVGGIAYYRSTKMHRLRTHYSIRDDENEPDLQISLNVVLER